MTNDFFQLLGLTPIEEFDPKAEWQKVTPASPMVIPVGTAEDGSTAALDMSRFRSLDDHFLIVGASTAGVTTLLRTILTVLSIRRSVQDLAYMVMESEDRNEYADMMSFPNCIAQVRTARGAEASAHRVSQWVLGEVEKRRAALAAARVADIGDYQIKVRQHADKDNASTETPWLPELFLAIDNVTWLLNTEFDAVSRIIRQEGHALGIRLLLSTPYDTWNLLAGSGYFDGITPRIAIGLTANQSAAVFGADVPHDLRPPGQAYLRTQQDKLVRFRIASVDEVYRVG